MLNNILKYLDTTRERVIEIQSALTEKIAIGPENNGVGEQEKAKFLVDTLKKLGVNDITVYDSLDPRVPSGKRPNIVAKVNLVRDTTEKVKTLWVAGHMDVVPAGELSLWSSDPFKLKVDGDYIIGRGVEDNQQAITSALLATEALLYSQQNNNVTQTPKYNLGLLFVADEETGNKHGIQFLLEQHAELFDKEDIFLIPDYGNNEGSDIEIAEKTQLWLKVTVLGRQCHASTPDCGINSLKAAAACILSVDNMHKRFSKENSLFNPTISTFSPTKKELNVENINTIPGKDVFYIDCRIIPETAVEDVLSEMKDLLEKTAGKYGASVNIEIVQLSPQTPSESNNSEFFLKLKKAIKNFYNVDSRAVGIGGGTVAGLLRAKGFSALVWSKLIPNPHVPNEKSRISCNIGDAKVIVELLF
ncbi:M20 family metallo-hydrolase [Desulfovibrio litoralis]|uniref:Succinyl-diaminopimelate desuccinylase n=1 Tax=Desulfovibrio litoralis DSM 11393 TaxID=1121455 RepID=A0A1M7SX76_9BACT|nr:M20 family metallo-hydrolase [Desulfovibrio litoralis]SHN62984.1 succinyl-diaminopimelate desuccinylase [Desulfovibrio litoralis DSM 11393]